MAGDLPDRDGTPAIGDYALIGDCGSAALVSRDGAIEWLCWPRFDSASIFAAILDRERGGRFRVGPAEPAESRRCYVDDTAVLETAFRTARGALRLRDCMVAAPGLVEVGALWPEHQILREVCCTEGEVEVEVRCDPRFDFARRPGRAEPRGALGVFFQHRGDVTLLRSEIPLQTRPGDGAATGRARLRAGERRFVALAYDQDEPVAIPPLGEHAARNLARTLDYWRGWSGRCDYQGPYRSAVVRSAVTLKLMTFASSGAVVAAPTTSLPERVGGVRNWDYRFCWLRDASFTLRALFELGYQAEGTAFFSWLLHATHHSRAKLRVLYDVFGGSGDGEVELDHLAGYRGSRPVRAGNAAEHQLQLDLYGEVVAAAYEFVRRGGSLGSWSGGLLRRIGDRVCGLWRTPDQGIWESRGPARRHVHSQALCWLALDRLLAMAADGHLRVDETRYRRTRDAIREAIEREGWSEAQHSYKTAFDGDEVDASLLLLALYGYVEPDAPRMRGTWERIRKELGADGLVMRYRHGTNDGLPPGEAAFGICSFWAVEYLARVGRVDEAVARFEALLAYGNDVGLFAEEIDPRDGSLLGNFPQAFTHVGLVSAALAIAEARGERAPAGLERKASLPPGDGGPADAEALSSEEEAR